ncbi:protein of unknown function DUF1996 [Kalmanozyma brasiliensis GHG001]|uniref:DUF1996 domain-containing protein n=1 Tax=Kalmanozyma brasiliensis (strain GHG001) TaxID=1365824 RepID=V5EQ60_KALBG|nr:protein of unknown function DUF1996 [Kalmanozyma brasiliensis GHG001]EST07270.1 protein of unknown function DUF1996 [Kalmanozyma brasiliensis GHG001]
MTVRSTLFWSLVVAFFAFFASVEVEATLANPVMWILSQKSLKQARVDPIVSPGRASSHTHQFVGANGISQDTTTAQALESASSCTTSNLRADMSAYWTPSLYTYNNATNTFTPNQLSFVNTYYLMRGNVQITAFPKGLQMLGGNAMRRGPGPTKQADNTASFVCLNYKDGSSQTQTIPDRPCPQGLRAQILFPSCWNGKDLTSSPTDQTHIVYPMGDNADNGQCPSTHPVRLPTLFYEFIYDVSNTDNSGNSKWVLANGDAMGYSMHGDFLAAWNETILQNAIDQCSGNLFGDLASCPPLNSTLDRAGSSKCNAASSEAVYPQSISSLPGCNMIWNGPNAGKGLTAGCDPSKVMLKPDNWTGSSNSSSSSVAAPANPTSTSSSVATPSSSTSSRATTTSARSSSTSTSTRTTSTAAQPAATCVCPSSGTASTQQKATTNSQSKHTAPKRSNKKPAKKQNKPRSLHREVDAVRRDARIVLQSIVERFTVALNGTGSATERLADAQHQLTILDAALADYGIVATTTTA